MSFVKLLLKSLQGKNIKLGFGFLLLLILLLGSVSTQINIALSYKFSQDLTLSLEAFILHAASILAAINLMANEKIRNYALACGVKRANFIMAIFAAIFCICAIISISFSVVNITVFAFLQNSIWLELTMQLWLFCLSATLFGCLFITLCFLFKSFGAFFYTIILFLAGSSSVVLYNLLQENSIVGAKLIFWIVPNFELFNMLGTLTSGANFNFFTIGIWAFLYFILYISALLIVAILAFKNRAL
ncbi:MAG: hypothetical protein RL154_692 [Pseudomonadota bacterium]|jgi:hypothetical protein